MTPRDRDMFKAGIEAAAALVQEHDPDTAAMILALKGSRTPVTPYRVAGVVAELTGSDEAELLAPEPVAPRHLRPVRRFAWFAIWQLVEGARQTEIADMFQAPFKDVRAACLRVAAQVRNDEQHALLFEKVKERLGLAIPRAKKQ